MSHSPAKPDEILPSLCAVRSVLELLNKAVIQVEAVHGVRLIEPDNHLVDELKQLNWCIARLNGVTDLVAPPSAKTREVQAEPRRTGSDRDDRQA
ncbi:hypothetical protein EQ836_07770 [Ectopseudomonas mendocina]|uniref:Uncharacterized protein n=1 Tax=Ectopseudomonas mendocina TaxID=300 RepID=A0ABD7RXA4_ECTME|nr:hypothetical protein [Pseudomonas mendocina]TRO14361.1 hypothetical protein EQ829_10165 [Pseudomonas mendocina]TRO19412.1 hypothetical protein EQ836_07770 [Pseudomonas mendocina]